MVLEAIELTGPMTVPELSLALDVPPWKVVTAVMNLPQVIRVGGWAMAYHPRVYGLKRHREELEKQKRVKRKTHGR